MSSKRALEAEQFRGTRSVLPEEHKAAIEEQIRIIETRRAQIINALSGGREIPGRIQRSLEHLGYEGHGLLADLTRILEEPDASTGELRVGRAAEIIDEKLRVLRSQLEALGGSTREQTVRVLEGLDLRGYWFKAAFNRDERDFLKKRLIDQADVPPAEQKSLDIGIGVARVSGLVLEAIERTCGVRARKAFAKNLYGIDIMPRFVAESQEELARYNVPPGNIVQGDFLALPPQFRQGQFDTAWANMHTLWHCTTEAQLRRFFRQMEQALKPRRGEKKGGRGGRLIFDTVGNYHHEGTPESRVVTKFLDLCNFYDVLIRVYREKHIDPVRGESLSLLRRFPVHDATAGTGSYSREVLQRDYVDYVLRKMGSKLRYIGRLELTNNRFCSVEEAKKLGFKWIEQNQLEGWLRKEIAYRVLQLERDPQGSAFLQNLLEGVTDPRVTLSARVLPLYALPQAERDAMELETDRPEINRVLERIAVKMVHDYVQRYLCYEMR